MPKTEWKNLVNVKLALRTPQINYIEYLAERDSVTFTEALRQIIAGAIQRSSRTSGATAKITSRHMHLPKDHIEFLDDMARQLGVDRSDVTRRLVDEERALDLTL